MDATHKKFITDKLIPFILREQGKGFGMDDWIVEEEPGTIIVCDNISRAVPKCGTVACIGGSAEYLGKRGTVAAEILGLTHDQAEGLFLHWEENHKSSEYRWPIKYMERYEKARTPLAKARVVVSLLKEVVKTNGECLKNQDYSSKGVW